MHAPRNKPRHSRQGTGKNHFPHQQGLSSQPYWLEECFLPGALYLPAELVSWGLHLFMLPLAALLSHPTPLSCFFCTAALAGCGCLHRGLMKATHARTLSATCATHARTYLGAPMEATHANTF